MDFELTDDQKTIQRAVADLAATFDDEYWAEKDEKHEFPWDFYKAFADAGWLGITMPEEYGGSGLGILEASLLLEEVAASGAGMNGASSMHLSIFGMHPVVKHGSDELKASTLPRIVDGSMHVCFGVTEPNAGPRHDAHHDLRQAQRQRRLRRQRPQGLDLQGAGVREDPAAHAHDQARGRRRRRRTA